MIKKDALIIKILSDIGALEETPLTDEQNELLSRALDPEKEFLHSVEKLFKSNISKK